MCLSTVMKKSGEENVLLLKNIASVKPEGETLVFTDLMGVRTRLEGKIIDIDLLENTILIESIAE